MPSERRPRPPWLLPALLVVLLTQLPYLWGAFLELGRQYLWINYNIDDNFVYLSWMRQAAEGRFFLENRFTTEPHEPRLFHLQFLAMGALARLTGLDPLTIYAVSRPLFALLFLYVLYRFLRLASPRPEARRFAWWTAAVGAGLGWLFWRDTGQEMPVDAWQPEAVTFLSLYLNPMFAAALALMLAVLGGLIAARRTGRLGYAALSGLAGAVLGNIHSYDVIPLAAVWGVYLALETARRRAGRREWGQALLAAAVAAPSVLYQYWVYRADPVFAERAGVATLTAPPALFLLGFGLLLLGALAAPLVLRGRAMAGREPAAWPDLVRLLSVWAAVGLLLPYVPVAFQRKLAMGVHLPLALLTGLAAAALVARLPERSPLRRAALPLLLLAAVPTNLRFVERDLRFLAENRTNTGRHAPYLSRDQVAALRWLRENTPEGSVVLAPIAPDLAGPVVAVAGRRTWAGHWGETPDFADKAGRVSRFFLAGGDGALREALLAESGADYVAAYRNPPQGPPLWADLTGLPALAPVYENDELRLFRVDPTPPTPRP